MQYFCCNMTINFNFLFNKSTDSVEAVVEEGTTTVPGPDAIKDLAEKVKIGIAFGVISLLLFLVLSIVYFNVPLINGPEYGRHNPGEDGKDGCRIYPFEVNPSPIILISGTDYFIYPKHTEDFLRFTPGQSLDFACPGGTVIARQLNASSSKSIINGTCVNGSRFKIENIEVDWRDFKCSADPLSTIRFTGYNCSKNNKEMAVGFEIAKNRFLTSMSICFNQELQRAEYTYVRLPSSINQRTWNTTRPTFQQGSGSYNIGDVNSLYLRKNQRITINRLVGLSESSTKYIQDNNNNFLSRGHLIANMDNFYAAQQNATFYYENAAPQWQTFNGYNWNQIEIDVRDYAEHNAVDLKVWSGVHGVATLPHETTGKPVQLFLFYDQASNKTSLPVPEIYWKVAYNPLSQRGIALIGVNNPYNSTVSKICDDVSDQVNWLHYQRENQLRGFCYACNIEDFEKVVTTLPKMTVKGLLY